MATVTASKRNAQLLADSAEISGNLVINGSITAPGFNKSNWDTAYGWGDHASEGYATQAYVNNAVSNLVDSAPTTLDTLNELATALGDDPNFAATVSDSIGSKVSKSGDTMTGTLTVPNLTIGSGNKIKFANNDYIRYDDANGVGRFHFDSDGGTNNASVQAATFVGALSGNASTASSAAKWTTARTNTVTLTGDATGSGSASVDGSGNWTVSVPVTVANDSHTHDGRYVRKTGDTMTGDLRLNSSGQSVIQELESTSNYGAALKWYKGGVSQTTFDPQVGHHNTGGDGTGSITILPYGTTTNPWSGSVGLFIANNSFKYKNQNIFHTGYHPNADKWTTARTNTVTLTGDATGSGSASVDGSGNWTVSVPVTVANDSHTHDGRYVRKSGDTMTGNLTTGVGLYFGTSTSYNYKPCVTGGIGTRSEMLSAANILLHADTDGSGTAEFVSIRAGAGTANELKLLSKTSGAGQNNQALTLNGNKVWNDAYHPVTWNDISGKPPIDNSVDYINAASFNTTTGVLTLSGVGRAGATIDLDGRYLTSETDNQTLSWNGTNGQLSISGGNTVDLDGRYLQSYSESDTLQTVCSRGSTTSTNITSTGNSVIVNTGSYANFVADGGTNQWKYLSLRTNGSTKWDIATKDNDLSGALQFRVSGGNTTRMSLDTSGNLTVPGLLTATQKSFTIDHPTKEGHKLRYGSLEGPENGVYVRGRLKDSNVIELPDVWVGLVHEDSITVSLTAIGKSQEIWVEDIMENKVIVGGDNVNCFYHIFAERKDVDKLVTEFQEVE